MNGGESNEHLVDLVRTLAKLPRETEWVEFKLNKAVPEEIGEYVSALANSAALVDEACAYLVWGIDDSNHQILGTNFSPWTMRVGQEELESWIVRLLTPRLHLQFESVEVDGKTVVLLEIPRASNQPVQFKKQKYVRIGSYTKNLAEFPEKERALWRAFDRTPFEDAIAQDRLSVGEVLTLLDYPTYFRLVGTPVPSSPDLIIRVLESDGLTRASGAGDWAITNLGAILIARNLTDFSSVRRKSLRVILYRANSRAEAIREREGRKGYASEFEDLITYIRDFLPENEVIGQALRTTVSMYPELAIRELVANALIHQDFSVTGAGPLIEVFSDRLEITNPGLPIVSPDRFLDAPPRSRNERLASLMRRMGICEERGSGIDKVVFEVEFHQLPAPKFETILESTRASLFAPRPLGEMEKEDRIRACYLHACLLYVTGRYMTNSTLRGRFGIELRNSATASRLIREAVDAKVIAPFDANAAPKLMKYVPFWA